MRALVTSLAVLCLVPASLAAQRSATGFLDRTVTVGNTGHRYQVYVPSKYRPDVDWPVILFLHGAAARGRDGIRPTDPGLGSAIRRNVERWPAIVVFPQVPDSSSWIGESATVALAALDKTLQEFRTDDRRIYLTGQSIGGQGAWYLAYNNSSRFAAVVIVCGFVGPLRAAGGDFPAFLPGDSLARAATLAERVQNLPLWIYHGDADSTVPVRHAREIAEALQRLGSGARYMRYIEIKGAPHNVWDPAYRSEELPTWLFQQRR